MTQNNSGEQQQVTDLFTVVLTSVGTELISFRTRTGKITDQDETKLTDDIVGRIMRKLKEYNLTGYSDHVNNIFCPIKERLSLLLEHVDGDEEKCVLKIQEELREAIKRLASQPPTPESGNVVTGELYRVVKASDRLPGVLQRVCCRTNYKRLVIAELETPKRWDKYPLVYDDEKIIEWLEKVEPEWQQLKNQEVEPAQQKETFTND